MCFHVLVAFARNQSPVSCTNAHRNLGPKLADLRAPVPCAPLQFLFQSIVHCISVVPTMIFILFQYMSCCTSLPQTPPIHLGGLDVSDDSDSDDDDSQGPPLNVTATDMNAFVNPLFDFIDAALAAGGSVLIHCLAGAHRAGTTGITCLMHYTGLDPSGACAALAV
jgi:hypothetical protein